MNIDSIKASLLKKLHNVRYRRAFANSHVGTQIAMQLRALRHSRDSLSQEKLAQDIGMAQARISVMEDPDYQNYNIKTLKRIAAFYDVVLDVRFISFRRFLDELLGPPDDLAPSPFTEAFPSANSAALLEPRQKIPTSEQTEKTVKDLLPDTSLGVGDRSQESGSNLRNMNSEMWGLKQDNGIV